MGEEGGGGMGGPCGKSAVFKLGSQERHLR